VPRELRNRADVTPVGVNLFTPIFARPEAVMDGIIYLVGLIVIIMFILSFLGLH
jgi:hypothetical protein